MALVRWKPEIDLWSRGRSIFDEIQDEINRVFDSFWSRTPALREDWDFPERAWSPNVDIEETDKEIIVTAELPGMSKEGIKVDIQDNTLTISGEKKQEKEAKERNYYRLERRYGSFQRSFMIPAEIDRDKVKASYRNGVLKVVLPKTEESQTRRIAVEVE